MNLKSSFLSRLVLSACSLMLIGAITSCNKKVESTEEIYMPASSVAVTNFSLKSSKSTTAKLDSVFFSIDLNKGVIFNADSLPVGTNITKLVPVISYPSTASEVTLTQTGGTKTGEINYMENPNDSVDFSGKVTLKITAEDKTTSRSYDIKVNVHKVAPDSLAWDQLALTPLPSRLAAPKEQKTVKFKDSTYSIIKESDDSFTMAVATDIIAGVWDKQALSLDFNPDVRSMSATSDLLYILDSSGGLHTSADGRNWDNTGAVWVNIIGAYDDTMLGIRNDGGTLVHTFWPLDADLTEQPVDAQFPLSGYSNLVQFSNRWTSLPVAFMCGGVLADGSLSDKTWGFDGDNWVILSEGMFPEMEAPTIVPYTVFRSLYSNVVKTELSVWMLIGGGFDNGYANRVIYLSYDNGVNWGRAETYMQLPDYFPSLRNLDGIVVEWPKQASLSANWSRMNGPSLPGMARMKFSVEDYEVYWDCPYIYIFGGVRNTGALNNEIWRGVLNRLSFMPQF